MRACPDFDPADATEAELFGFDFASDLPPGETITGVESFTLELISGSDANAGAHLLAPPTFDGTVVSRLVANLQPYCRYRLIATVITNLGHLVTLGSYVSGEQI